MEKPIEKKNEKMTISIENSNYRGRKLNLEKMNILNSRGSQKVAKVTFKNGKWEHLGLNRVAEPSTWREKNQDFGRKPLSAALKEQ